MLSSVAPAADGAAHRPSYLFASSFLLGLGLLTPFNMTLNLIPFLSEAYAWPDIGYYTSLCLTYPSIFVQFILVPCGQRLTSRTRIHYSFLLGALALACLGSLGATSPALGLLLMLLGGTCTAVLEGSLFGWLSRFPDPLCATCAMAGVASAGVVATALQLLLRAALPGQNAAAAGVFTACGVLVLAACVRAHSRLSALAEAWLEGRGPGGAAEANEGAAALTPAPSAGSPPAPWVKGVWPEPEASIQLVEGGRRGACGTPGLNGRLLRLLLLPLTTIVLNFVATFMVFPGLIASVPYRGGGAWPFSARRATGSFACC